MQPMPKPRPGRPRKFADNYPVASLPERELTRREADMIGEAFARHFLRLSKPRGRRMSVITEQRDKTIRRHERSDPTL